MAYLPAVLAVLVIAAGCGKAAVPETEAAAGSKEEQSSSDKITETAPESTEQKRNGTIS